MFILNAVTKSWRIRGKPSTYVDVTHHELKETSTFLINEKCSLEIIDHRADRSLTNSAAKASSEK
jgi:hypothetical protein